MSSDPAPYYETDSITLRNRHYCTAKQTLLYSETGSTIYKTNSKTYGGFIPLFVNNIYKKLHPSDEGRNFLFCFRVLLVLFLHAFSIVGGKYPSRMHW